MSGLTNNDLYTFQYLFAVMILFLIVLVYQVYYILLPKVSQIAKIVGVEGIGVSHHSLFSDRSEAGTLGLYIPNDNVKSGFFGGDFEQPGYQYATSSNDTIFINNANPKADDSVIIPVQTYPNKNGYLLCPNGQKPNSTGDACIEGMGATTQWLSERSSEGMISSNANRIEDAIRQMY